MNATFRILVTGSRSWTDVDAIRDALSAAIAGRPDIDRPVVVVHGACLTGADAIADRVASFWRSVTIERWPADWETHGRRAGYRRNAEMVALGAGVCLAFIRDGSRGATHCAGLAEKAGIVVRRYTA